MFAHKLESVVRRSASFSILIVYFFSNLLSTGPWEAESIKSSQFEEGVFRDLEELIMAVGNYVDLDNLNPKPLIWTASAGHILQKVNRARKTLDNVQSV